MKKCRVQFLNVYTHEILRNELMNDEIAKDMIKTMVDNIPLTDAGEPAFIMDNQQKLYNAKYMSYKESIEDNEKIYRVYFQVKLLEKQPIIKK